MTTDMLKAEKKIKIRDKHYPWSPTLALAILTLHLCEVIHKTNKLEKVASIITQMNKYKQIDCRSIERVDKTIIKKKLQMKKKQVRKIQKNAT